MNFLTCMYVTIKKRVTENTLTCKPKTNDDKIRKKKKKFEIILS